MLGAAGPWFGLALLLWLAAHGLLLLARRRDLVRLWREPMLRQPVLIVESDDWGAGPLSQADALRAIADVLDRHRDTTGRPPVMSLALVLAVPDGPAIRADGAYHRVDLDDPRFDAILAALRGGAARGVFALQLHGLEHYWPATLMASRDAAVRDWLEQPVPATTERLPSHLQSRWADTSGLPSRPHDAQAIRSAVADEVRAYARVIGERPVVVVPPTFVWTREVELAWEAKGLSCVVTPGWRYPGRGTDGLPAGDEGPIVSGQRAGRLGYVARSDYFEPVRGRDAVHALRVLARSALEGRACLLENHRDNFIGEPQACRHSLDELDKLYREALARHADLRFVSTAELNRILQGLDPEWLTTHWRERVPVLWQRLQSTGRLWKLLRLSGASALGRLVVGMIGIRRAAPRREGLA